jgi:hypothetical protein
VSPRSGFLGFGAGIAEIFGVKRPVFGDGAQRRSLRVRRFRERHVKRGLRNEISFTKLGTLVLLRPLSKPLAIWLKQQVVHHP